MSITTGGNPTLGQPYTLTCGVSAITGTPTVQWVGPRSSAPITNGRDFTVRFTRFYTLTITINPLRQSHAGQYTCWSSVGNDTATASATVDIIGSYSLQHSSPGGLGTILFQIGIHRKLQRRHTTCTVLIYRISNRRHPRIVAAFQ